MNFPLRAAGALLCFGLAAAPAAADCRLSKVAQMPLTPLGNHYAAPVTVNGVARQMVVDTGAELTIFTARFADELALPPDAHSQRRIFVGIGAAQKATRPNVVPRQFAIGDLVYRDRSTAVATLNNGATPEADSVGLIGDDILSQFDVEMDFPGKTMTFYRSFGCYGTFLPWTGDFATVPFARPAADLVIDIALNGERTRALVDTGNNQSFVSRDAAALWGTPVDDLVETRGRARSPLGDARGLAIESYSFGSMALGGDVFRNQAMAVLDVDFPLVAANIGLDYWKARKIWISYPTGWMFVADAPAAAKLAYPVDDARPAPAAAAPNVAEAAAAK